MNALGPIEDILSAGILAPSPDNSQPWKFRVSGEAVEIWADPAQMGMFFDAGAAATLMSCGAVAENMCLAATRHGLEARVTVTASWDVNRPVASLQFEQVARSADPLAAMIAPRASHRGLFRRGDIVTDEQKRTIDGAIAGGVAARVIWADDPRSRQALVAAVCGADAVRFTHPAIHRDFHATLRFGHSADIRRDGLAADTLGIERGLLPLLRLLAPWPLTRLLNGLGLQHFMVWRGSRWPLSTAPQLAVLVAGADASYFAQGRALQRLWLASCAAGLDFQALGALPLLLIRLRDQAGDGLNANQQKQLDRLDAKWREVMDIPPGQTRLVMICRLGHARRPAIRSRRRPLSSFLRDHRSA
jgi:hypothetical protein